MDPALVKQLLLGSVPPLVLGVIVFGLLWWRKQPDLIAAPAAQPNAPHDRLWQHLLLLACAAACFLGVFPLAFGKIQAWPGASADGSLFWCAVVALAAGLLWCFVRNAWSRTVIVLLALAACAWLSFRRQLFDSWGTGESLATLALLLGGGGVFAIALARLGDRGRITGVIGSVAAVGLGAQVLVVCLASLKHAQGAGAFASFLTFAMVMVLLRPTRALSAPMLAMIGILLATQLVQLVRFGDGKFPWLMAGLVMSGPALGLIAMRLFQRGGVVGVIVPLLATTLPALFAVGTGAYFSLHAEKSSVESDYEY